MKITTRQKLISKDGTKKFLFELDDGSFIESVLMFQDFGTSLCITTQVGCSMGCKFCASGLLKKERNLSAEEMLLEVFEAQKESPTPITHVVLMGTGEPFDNYNEVIRFCDIISDEKSLNRAFDSLQGYPLGLNSLSPEHPCIENEMSGYFSKPASLQAERSCTVNNIQVCPSGLGSFACLQSIIAPRHITVSTCGLVPKIYEFAKTKKRYNLAISLHAPNDELRNELMPVNKKFPLKDLIEAVSFYCNETKHRVTFEYILLDGINDSDECALLLAALLKDVDAYVNLIPFNAVEEFSFRGVPKEKALHFYDILMQNKIRATLRKERGSDISAACGQLRAEALNHTSPHQS